MTHTPGPWTHGPVTHNGRPWGYGATIGKRVINMDAGGHQPLPKEEAEANARLIAAAPDMLAALKAINEGLVHWRVGGKEMEMLKAAIAKAEGKPEVITEGMWKGVPRK